MITLTTVHEETTLVFFIHNNPNCCWFTSMAKFQNCTNMSIQSSNSHIDEKCGENQ